MEQEKENTVEKKVFNREKLLRCCSGYGIDFFGLWKDMEELARETVSHRGYDGVGNRLSYPYEMQLSLYAAKIDRKKEMLDFVEDERRLCHVRVDVLVFRSEEDREEYLKCGGYLDLSQ